MEAGATVRQVNMAIEVWPSLEDATRKGVQQALLGAGLRRLQAKVIYDTLVQSLALFEDEDAGDDAE